MQARLGDRLKTINEGVAKDGAFYLFALRVVPVFPFFLVNLAMGLTPIRTRTFYWVSQLGMLAGEQPAAAGDVAGRVGPAHLALLQQDVLACVFIHQRLPVIAAPMFIAGNPRLVTCRAYVLGV